MSSRISLYLETVDRIACCIPVVSTVTNVVHLLAKAIMVTLERFFGVSRSKVFGEGYRHYLEEDRRPVLYVSLIPVVGNCLVGALWLHDILQHWRSC